MTEIIKVEKFYPSLDDFDNESQNNTVIKNLIFNSIIKDKVKFSKELIKINSSLDPLIVNKDGQTLLMYACKNKKWTNASVLLTYFGVSCISNLCDNEGYDLLYYASYDSCVIQKILAYDYNFNNFRRIYKDNQTILTILLNNNIKTDLKKIVDLMDIDTLNKQNENGENALILSCKTEKFQTSLDIINRGVKLTYHDKKGFSAMSYILKNIDNSTNQQIVHVCLRLITKANKRNSTRKTFNPEVVFYEHDQFVKITDVEKAKGTYGTIKWAIDRKSGDHKMLKQYHNFNNLNLVKEDMLKEFIFIRKMNEMNDHCINVDGIYIDSNGRFHLVFEPLAINLYKFFKIISKNIDLLKSKVKSIYEQLCDYVRNMHHLGIIHNDLKLENIMIGYDGKIKILDFGISEFLGYSPNVSVASHYITTSYIRAPDFSSNINFKIYDEFGVNIVGDFKCKSNRKSYSSDVYSLGVSIIQGILGESMKFIYINDKLYYVSKDDECNQSLKGRQMNINIKPVNKLKIKILSSYCFFDDLMRMVDVDSNVRIKRSKLPEDFFVYDYVKSDKRIINNIVHYSSTEIRYQLNEMVYAEDIFKSYKNSEIKMSGRNYSINYASIFSEIISFIPKSASIDTILNAMCHTLNYKGSEDISIVFISYLYIFSFIFEWYTYPIEEIAKKLVFDTQILICKINNTIFSLLGKVNFIPYIVLIEKIIIILQRSHGYYTDDLHKIEDTVYKNFRYYFSNISNNETFEVWELIQMIIYSSYPLPFEIECKNDIVLEIYKNLVL
uniref:Protein kinase domain-containing protein n=1 Tax=viral metagenome TaxID=1070528 RepID=A0A6C0BCL7_9ZZZZ